jgi:undecaprenyl-diphosphatase
MRYHANMSILHICILSIIEGITEFLPISSTGHMILASSLLHIQETEFVKSFEIIIQLGAIMAIVVLYAKKIILNKQIYLHIGAAFLPTAIIGYILYKIIKRYLLGNPWVVVISLFLGGVVLILIELIHKKNEPIYNSIEQLSLPKSLLIGIYQSLSVIPGVSRAAATIIGGQFSGLSRQAAVEFSFLLAIPTMTAATGLDLIKTNAFSYSLLQWQQLGLGCLISFVTALVVVKLFLTFIQKHTFLPFGIYRIAIAIIFTIITLR